MNVCPGGIATLDGNVLASLTMFFEVRGFSVVLVFLDGGGFSESSSSELNSYSEN